MRKVSLLGAVAVGPSAPRNQYDLTCQSSGRPQREIFLPVVAAPGSVLGRLEQVLRGQRWRLALGWAEGAFAREGLAHVGRVFRGTWALGEGS